MSVVFVFSERDILYSASVVFCIQGVWYFVFSEFGILYSESVVFCIQRVWYFVFIECGILYSSSVVFYIQQVCGILDSGSLFAVVLYSASIQTI